MSNLQSIYPPHECQSYFLSPRNGLKTQLKNHRDIFTHLLSVASPIIHEQRFMFASTISVVLDYAYVSDFNFSGFITSFSSSLYESRFARMCELELTCWSFACLSTVRNSQGYSQTASQFFFFFWVVCCYFLFCCSRIGNCYGIKETLFSWLSFVAFYGGALLESRESWGLWWWQSTYLKFVSESKLITF